MTTGLLPKDNIQASSEKTISPFSEKSRIYVTTKYTPKQKISSIRKFRRLVLKVFGDNKLNYFICIYLFSMKYMLIHHCGLLKYLILFFLFITNISFTQANKENVLFESLTVKDGLPQMSVLDITQDTQGYIWMATRDGLARYDGYSFDIFRNDENDTLSISNNYVVSVQEDKNKNLWIGTLYGLNRYNANTETFTRFYHSPINDNTLSSNEIRKIYIDDDNNVWIGTTNGLNLYLPKENKFLRYCVNPDIDHRVSAILRIGQTILTGTDSGLYTLSLQTNKIKQLSIGNFKELSVKALYKGKNEDIYIGTFNQGLLIIDKNFKLKEQHLNTPLKDNSLSNNSIRCITANKHGQLLIGTFNGLNIFDPETGNFRSFKQQADNLSGLSHFSIHSVCCDSANTIWIGTWAGGVNYCNLDNNNIFQLHSPVYNGKRLLGIVGPLVKDANGIWVGMEGGGLLYYENSTDKYERYIPYKSNASNFRSNIVTSLHKKGHLLYVGTNNGILYQFDTRNRQFIQKQVLPGTPSIVTIHSDRSGNILLGVQDTYGLIIISPEGHIQNRFKDKSGNDITFNNICSIIDDGPDTFLLGSNTQGIYQYNLQSKEYAFYNLKNPELKGLETKVNQLYQDSRKITWVATAQQGILCLDKDKNIIQTISTSDGMKSNTICAINADKDGNIWASTLSSITQIEKDNYKIKNYGGFKTNEFALRSCLSTDSIIYFGGDMGFIAFDPSQIEINTFVPPVVIKEVLVNNTKVSLRELDYHHQKIVLPYDRSNITFEYRALNYIRPEQNQYAYRMEGFDKDWIQVGNRLIAHYTNLPAGKYTFHVKAGNNDNVWNEKGVILDIEILPPPWKTWWAYIAYIAIFLGLVASYLRYLQMRVKLTNDVKIKQIEQENSEKLHADRINLFTNFSHELRTPLTLIIAPLEDLLGRADTTASVKKSLGLMHNNAKRLLFLVNQLMDFRKKEAGKLQIKVAEGNFSLFVEEIVIAFQELANSRHMTLEYFGKEDNVCLWYDRSLMEKVLFNLLSNAFKNTPDKGKIVLKVHQYLIDSAKWIEITVSDTGCGIPINKQNAIFDPFYQVNETETATPGTGIGLYLTKAIVELHRGKIKVESVPDKGTTFIINLPVGKEYFTADEIIENYKSSEDISRYINTSYIPEMERNMDEAESMNKQNGKHTVYTLLIAEDNKEVRTYVKNNLANEYNIIEAANGEDALTKAINQLPDLIISDIMMPKIDGIQLCKTLKEDLRTGHIPVILLTARTTVLQIEEGLKIGADDYITKPFNMTHLKLRISNILCSREKLKNIYSKSFNTQNIGEQITSADDRFLQKLYKVMEENISNPELNIDKFCKEIGMSKTNLYYKIKSLTNFSPTEFIRHSRLQLAARLLREKEIPISEISTITGFNSHSYFSNCFKAVYGCSPTEYSEKNL